MPTIELHRTDRTKESSKLLQKFAFDDTSQFGEDGILEEVFKRIHADHDEAVGDLCYG